MEVFLFDDIFSVRSVVDPPVSASERHVSRGSWPFSRRRRGSLEFGQNSLAAERIG
jgi:hypothetical protein